MEKPKRMTDVAIDEVDPDERSIKVWIDRSRIEPELDEFGTWWNQGGNLWTLTVDGRYIFSEVWRYIEALDTSVERKLTNK